MEIFIDILIIIIYLISLNFITNVFVEKLSKYDHYHRIFPVVLILLASSLILNKLFNGFLFFEVTIVISLLYIVYLLFVITVMKKYWNAKYNSLAQAEESTEFEEEKAE